MLQVGCGDVVAVKTKEYLPKKLLQLRASGKYQKFGPPGDPLPDVGTSAYERAFDSVSRQILREMREKSNMAGSTAVTVFMSGNAIHVANVGDSRAILGRRTEEEVRRLRLPRPSTLPPPSLLCVAGIVVGSWKLNVLRTVHTRPAPRPGPPALH